MSKIIKGSQKTTDPNVIWEVMSLKGTKNQRQISADYGISMREVGRIHRGERKPE